MYRKTEETDFSSTSYGRNGVLLIGRGVAYHKTEETNFSLTSYGRNGGPIHREGCGVPQNGTPRATVHPPTTSSSLHLLLYIHHQLPPASTSYYSSTGSPFIQPPPATIHPALHGVMFIQSPPSTVQPALHGVLFNLPLHGVMFNPSTYGVPPTVIVHPPPRLLDRGPVHPAATSSTTTGSCSSNPHRELFIKRQLRSASVSSSSEGITRVQLTARDQLGFSSVASAIARVQLEPNALLRFS